MKLLNLRGFVILALCAVPGYCGLVSNGTFLPGGGPSFTTIYPTGNAIPGWTVIGGPGTANPSVDWIGGYWQAPTGGGFSVDLDGSYAVSGITQNISTNVGQTYTLSFELSGNPDGAPTIKTVDVSAGSTINQFSFDTTGTNKSNMGWVSESFNFTATSTSTAITFLSTDSPTTNPYGPVIGDVSVSSATPEPGFYGMLVFGFAGLGFMVKRQRRA